MKAEEVGYRIAQARKKQGMTQRELSERLHVSDKAVSKWERGVNYPDISLFDEIAKTLDLSLVELLGIEDRSKEEIVQNISEISKYEKEKIGKEIYQRGLPQTPETDLHQTMLQGYRRRVQRHRLQGSVLLRQSQEMS